MPLASAAFKYLQGSLPPLPQLGAVGSREQTANPSCARFAVAPTGSMRYFCDNGGCCQGLGDFRLMLEEFRAEAHWHQLLAGRVTAFVAKPQLVAAHSLELDEICAAMCDLLGDAKTRVASRGSRLLAGMCLLPQESGGRSKKSHRER